MSSINTLGWVENVAESKELPLAYGSLAKVLGLREFRENKEKLEQNYVFSTTTCCAGWTTK